MICSDASISRIIATAGAGWAGDGLKLFKIDYIYCIYTVYIKMRV